MIGNKESITKLLLNINETMKASDLEFFLLHGNLLGYYRDKDVIPWDDDIDLGCILISDDKYEIPNKIVDLFKDKSYVTSTFIKKTEEWNGACNVIFISNVRDVFPKQGNLTIGKITFTFKFIKRIADRAIEASSPVSYNWNAIKPLEQISYLGAKFHIPAKPEELFDIWYGKDCWKIPSRRAWIMKQRDKGKYPDKIVMYHDQKMGYRAKDVEEALLQCNPNGEYITPYVKTGKTPR